MWQRCVIRSVMTLVIVIGTLETTTACKPECNESCVAAFRDWASRGGKGSIPASGLAYCAVHPEATLCPN